jgi:hypothetical protein
MSQGVTVVVNGPQLLTVSNTVTHVVYTFRLTTSLSSSFLLMVVAVVVFVFLGFEVVAVVVLVFFVVVLLVFLLVEVVSLPASTTSIAIANNINTITANVKLHLILLTAVVKFRNQKRVNRVGRTTTAATINECRKVRIDGRPPSTPTS